MDRMALLDWIVIGVYGAAVLGIGWWANRRQTSSEAYFLGGRSLPWWAVGVSLIATSFSSASLIGGTGWGFANGLGYLQLQIGDLLAIGVVALVFLPFFAGLGITTAYEYLERRFGALARSLGSLLFMAQTLLRTSLLIYAPALALSTLLGWDLTTAIVVTAVAAIVYSVFGGISAVVWTDLIQFGVILVSVAMCLWIVVSDVPGGLSAVLDHAAEAEQLEPVSVEWNPRSPFNLAGSILAYGILALSLFGTGQQAVQRFLACEDVRAARRAAFTGWAAGAIAVGACLFLGVCLSAWVELAPNGTPLGAKADQVLPAFVGARLPAGAAGLLLAAIFAAAMSSIDSAIHSISTCTIVDFVVRYSKNPPDDRGRLRAARWVTALVGVVSIGGALLAAEGDKSLLDTMIKWLGYVAGPLLGLFLLGMLTRRATQVGALLGVLAAATGIAIAVLGTDAFNLKTEAAWHPLWLAPASALATFVLGWTASWLTRSPSDEDLRGLTIWTRS